MLQTLILFCACATIADYTAAQDSVLIGPAAFGDYRNDFPGTKRKITPADLPAPNITSLADATFFIPVVPRPEGVFPKVKPGFAVQLLAGGFTEPRLLRTAPNGDVFVAEGHGADRITILRRNDTTGGMERFTYATSTNGLNLPFGMAFHPPGDNPTHIYVANTGEIVRFAYKNGDTAAAGAAEVVTKLPAGGHWTRDVIFSKDGLSMFAAVGSNSNVQAEPNVDETDRAMVLKYNVDGTGKTQFATGIRNPVTIAFHPETNDLWTSVNERDGMGENLAPDYITRIKQGEFFGWPWFYIGNNTDPRPASRVPGNIPIVSVPEVLIQAHSASLQMTFYTGSAFPAEYKNDIFAAQHGSWNRGSPTGYKVIRVLEQDGVANGVYEDFMTGFLTENGTVWGRPVGVTVAKDGSLWVSDDGSNSIWRVWYNGTMDGSNSGVSLIINSILLILALTACCFW